MLTPHQTVASLVLEHSECAAIFLSHRIDFCCRGDLTIQDACADKGIDADVVVRELSQAIAERVGEREVDPRTLSTAALIAHIVSEYHDHLRRTLPFVGPLAAKVSRVHGSKNPNLRDLDAAVRELVGTLTPHIDDEERSLFPALLAQAPDRLLIASEFVAMFDDHLAIAALLERIRSTSEDFLLPDWACNSYHALFSELEQLEVDIRRHVHLENHVLGPRFSS